MTTDPSPTINAFDLCGPLPSGVTVLEASAGTGKTFTIAALAARYVAGGRPLQDLLLVTFTRMATGELRERVRERLVHAEEGLARVQAGAAIPADDGGVLRLLADADPAEVALRQSRLARALTDFDAATITTTHGFCDQVLSGLGVAGDVEPDITFVEDVSDLVEEVVDDFYIRKFHRGGRPPFDRAEAVRIARKAVDNPSAPLEPRQAKPDSPPDVRRRFATAVRDEVERRKRAGGLLTYDDLLTRLRDTLADPVRGPAACEQLRSRYKVALVDEFQDTDPVQWEIMRRAFGPARAAESGDQPPSTLVLIGDPKQAIYAFRGADVYAYLDAVRRATTVATLETNWRSDQGLLDAYDALFGDATLGHSDIAYRRVAAVAGHRESRLAGAPVVAPLRLRVVDRADALVELSPQGYVRVFSGRVHIAQDLAADVVRLLSSPVELPDHQPVRPGDVAVLVRTHRHAGEIHDALDAVGIPAVINGAGSVFGTPIAREWLRFLEALERPTSRPRAASAALTSFLGWSAQQLASADDDDWESLHAKLHRWTALLRRRGVASLLEAVSHTEGLPARVLATTGGERALTDLRHAGQLLHAAATSEQLGVTAITAWLRQRINDAADDTGNEERSRRLESDAEAVQVLTIHRSKGLEFPIVYYPYLWDPMIHDGKLPPVFHDPANNDVRTIDVGGPSGREYGRNNEQFVMEERGEELRLAYVALTRARHQAVVWWAGSWESRNSALSRLLFSRDADGNVAAEGSDVPDDDAVLARFEELAAAVPGRISVERSDGGTGARWQDEPTPFGALAARPFERTLDSAWRRTSYSGITAAAYEARVGSEPEQPAVTDEQQTAAVFPGVPLVRAPGPTTGATTGENADEPALRAVSLLLGAMPGGAEVGTLVHSVLETTDFGAADLEDELTGNVRRQQARQGIDIGDPTVVVEGLRAAIETPLGPLVGDLRLRDIGRRDRLDELWFELPLVGGDAPAKGTDLTVAAIGALLREHLRADDPFAGYADRLDDPTLHGDLRGYLAGSLDMVVRINGDAARGAPRFAVVDHKTNWLGASGEELTAWHYRPAALVEEMQQAHYPLQALLYSAALHRYLRWRLPDYDPARNLAGVLYVFLRGMAGAGAPRVDNQPCGVLAWNPSPELIVALSDLLDIGVAAA
ncbi:MAG TPA: UvrD-helicase domain-containing protein [Acidimicrobiales bacterium]|nr:UvrD-helicase domain-containing protein [Acidimicrobiales bacterium]